MENRLNVSTKENVLVGYSNGKEMYNIHFANTLRFDAIGVNVIVFPNTVMDISISFVNGFTDGLFKRIGRNEFRTYIKIDGRERVVEKFYKSIMY